MSCSSCKTFAQGGNNFLPEVVGSPTVCVRVELIINARRLRTRVIVVIMSVCVCLTVCYQSNASIRRSCDKVNLATRQVFTELEKFLTWLFR